MRQGQGAGTSALQNRVACAEPRFVRALVVDSSDTALRAVCELMELESYIEVVGRASDGVDAIAAVASLHPELVIMDINIPYLDGFKTAAILGEHYPLVRIVLMSSEDLPQIRADANRFGADGFVYKGDLIADMHRTLRRLFPKGR